jgi:hypothetical protein
MDRPRLLKVHISIWVHDARNNRVVFGKQNELGTVCVNADGKILHILFRLLVCGTKDGDMSHGDRG